MNESKNFSKRRIPLVGSLILITGLSPAFGDTITDTTITGESSILNTGMVLVAHNTGPGAAATTIKGIAFAGSNSGLSGGFGGSEDFSDQLPAGSPLDILLSTVYQGNFTLMLSGLTSGDSYVLQLLMADDLQNRFARTFQLTIDGQNITETLPYTKTGAKDLIIDLQRLRHRHSQLSGPSYGPTGSERLVLEAAPIATPERVTSPSRAYCL